MSTVLAYDTALRSDRAGSDDLVTSFRAMATDVSVRVVSPTPAAPEALARVKDVFRRVEEACTRFNPTSPLMTANATPTKWHQVPVELFQAVREAADAYHETAGLFDPRVLNVLRSWGYDRSRSFQDGPVRLNQDDLAPVTPKTPLGRLFGSFTRQRGELAPPGARQWRPKFAAKRRAVRLGELPLDLGGIGKGLAVRWGADQVRGTGTAALIEAGGDLQAIGAGPDGAGWHIAVEDPRGGASPVAVLNIADAACATSSIRLRRWSVNGRDVHHLVDPRTGESGGDGLLAVTVVNADPAKAEVWSKALFLSGRSHLRDLADERGIAALLIDADGTVGMSRAMRSHVLWQAPRGW